MVFAAGRRPVDVVEFLVKSKGLVRASLGEISGKLLPGRNGRSAPVPGYGEGPARIGVLGAGLPRLAFQPTAQEAAHKGIAGAENVIDLDWKTGPLDALFHIFGNSVREDHAAYGAALADDSGVSLFAHRLDRRQSIRGAAGDVQFFLGTDQ